MFNMDRYTALAASVLSRKDITCSTCGACGRIEIRNDRPFIHFTSKFCRKLESAWTGTFFKSCHHSPAKVIAILDYWLEGVSKKSISRLLGIGKRSLWQLFCKVSSVLVPRFYQDLEPLGGDGLIVDFDESKFGKRKNHRGHRVEGT